jgi:hypothetical protein
VVGQVPDQLADELRERHGGPYGVAAFDNAVSDELASGTASIDLAWTDITWLLYLNHVSWAYYVQAGTQPDCANDAVGLPGVHCPAARVVIRGRRQAAGDCARLRCLRAVWAMFTYVEKMRKCR